MAGTSAQNNKYDFISAQKSGFLYDSVSQLGNGSTIKSADGNQNEWAIFSLMARANYDYADKYLLTATVRRDGSSRFGSGHKYGIFPSFSTAWTAVKLDDTGDNKWSMTQSQCGKAYKIALDITPGKESMVMTEFTPYTGIYMVGDATPNGWSVDNATAMTAVDAYTFTWTGNLTAGELKFT